MFIIFELAYFTLCVGKADILPVKRWLVLVTVPYYCEMKQVIMLHKGRKVDDDSNYSESTKHVALLPKYNTIELGYNVTKRTEYFVSL
jgi:hypothetical protein